MQVSQRVLFILILFGSMPVWTSLFITSRTLQALTFSCSDFITVCFDFGCIFSHVIPYSIMEVQPAGAGISRTCWTQNWNHSLGWVVLEVTVRNAFSVRYISITRNQNSFRYTQTHSRCFHTPPLAPSGAFSSPPATPRDSVSRHGTVTQGVL